MKIWRNKSRIVAVVLALLMGSESIGLLSLQASEEIIGDAYDVITNVAEHSKEVNGYVDISEKLNISSFEIDDFLENSSFNIPHGEELEVLIHTLANSTSFYSSLSEDDKLTMLFELSVREDSMRELEAHGLNIKESIIKSRLMQMFNISATEVFTLVRNHNGEEQAMGEALRLSGLIVDFPHVYIHIDILIELFIEGYTVDELISLIVIFNMTGIEISNLAMRGKLSYIEAPDFSFSEVTENEIIEEDEPEYSEIYEKIDVYPSTKEPAHVLEINSSEVIELARSYAINPQVLYDLLSENMVNMQRFQQAFRETQRLLGLYRTNDIMARSSSSSDDPIVSRMHESAPFDFSRSQRESVNLNTGSLIYIDEIVSLRGRGGFDLNLALRYDSSTATDDLFRGDRNREIFIAGIFDHSITDGTQFRIDRAWGEHGLPTTVSTNINIIYGTQPRTNRYIATGWSLNTTRIVFEPDIFNSRLPRQRFLRLTSGASYEMVATSDLSIEFTLRNYYLDDIRITRDLGTFPGSTHVVSYANGLREYFDINGLLVAQVDKYKNVITYVDTGNILTITHNTGEQVVISFSWDMITVTLPDGNIIRYDRTVLSPPTLTQKIDQEGNITRFTYSIQGARFNFFDTRTGLPRLNLPTEVWQNLQRPWQIAAFQPPGIITESPITFVSVDDHIELPWTTISGRLLAILNTGNAWIIGNQNDQNVNAAQNGNHDIRYALLTRVEYPTGLTTHYSYRAIVGSTGGGWRDSPDENGDWIREGFMEHFSLSERWNQVPGSSTRYNHVRYDYGNINYTEFRTHVPTENTYSVIETRYTAGQAHNIEHIYNYRHLKVEERHYIGSVSEANLFSVIRYEYNDKNLPIRIEREDIGSNGRIVTMELFEYDNFGNVTHHWNSQAEGERNDEFLTKFTYDSRFNMLTSRTHKMNASTTLREDFILTWDGRSVSSVRGSENGVLRSRVDYFYDTFGNITLTRQFINETQFISESIVYHQNGAHPIRITRGNITTEFAYDVMGNVLSIRDGNGNLTSFTYDRRNREVARTQADGSVIEIEHNDRNNILRITDERGYTTEYHYTAMGQLSLIVEQETGNVIASFEYGVNGELIREVDALGNETKFTHDHLLRVISRTSGNFKELIEYIDVYDSNRRAVKTTIIGEAGAPTQVSMIYANKHGFVIAESGILDGQEILTSYTHDYVGNILTELTEEHTRMGRTYTVRYEYDIFGNVLTTTNALGQTVRNEYDWLGRRTAFIDASGSRFTYEYDTHNNLITERIPFDENHYSIRRFTYDRNHNLISESVTIQKPSKPERLSQTFYTYDVMNRLIMVESAGEYTKYEYDLSGNLITMIAGNGLNVQSYEYDRNGNVIRFVDAEGFVELYRYDANGNLIEKTDRNGQVISHRFDELNRLVETVSGGHETTPKPPTEPPDEPPDEPKQGVATISVINPNAMRPDNVIFRATEMVTEEGETAYTLLRKTGLDIVSVGGGVVSINGLSAGSDRNRPNIAYIWRVRINGSFAAPLTILRDGDIVEWIYELILEDILPIDPPNPPGGWLALGASVSFERFSEGSPTSLARYEYSRNGLLILEENENITIQHEYDSLGRLIRSTQSDGVVKAYTYDLNNNRTSMRMYLNGELTAYSRFEYDLLNRMVRVFENGRLLAEYSYDINGNRSRLRYSNGVETTYTFNRANLVTELVNRANGQIVSSFKYSYYLDGNMSTIVENCDTITTYEYDELRRLIREEEIGERGHFITEYEFDNSGNRIRMISTVNGEASVTVYEYDLNNRLLSDETINLTTQTTTINTYEYDNNGNKLVKLTNVIELADDDNTPSFGMVLLRDGSDAESPSYVEIFTYDVLNRLVRAELSGVQAEYTYRPDGLRITKTVNGEITQHIWDGMNLIADATDDNVVVFYRGLNLIFSTEHGYYLFNARGDVVQLVDSNRSITREYRYDAFGVERDRDDNDTNPFRFTGEYFDIETNTVYLRARHYNPRLGRFTQPDPHWNINNMVFGDIPLDRNGRLSPNLLAIRQATNLFGYCLNNPIRWVDPTGRIIRLSGTGEERQTLLSHLQMLTDHRLDINDRGTVFIDHFATSNIQFASGNTLIERMIENPHIITISLHDGNFFDAHSWENAFIPSIGSGGIIGFNPDLDIFVYTLNSRGVASLQRVPAHITLAHELVHADRAMRGVAIPGSLVGTTSFQVERVRFSPFRIHSTTRTITHEFQLDEMATIGIRRYTPNCITENMIRREHGLNLRASHLVRR